MNVSISFGGISSSLLIIGLGALVVLLILIILIRIFSRGNRHRTARSRNGQNRERQVAQKRRDHGAEIARKHGRERSPEWPKVEREHRQIEPACVACGYKGSGLQVHHIRPFHLHPNLELDQKNLITLCEVSGRDHHLLLGHLDEWESYNVDVRADAKRYYGKSADQIRADAAWQKKMKQRP